MNLQKIKNIRNHWLKQGRLKKYLNSKVPWSEGYEDYKWNRITELIHDEKVLEIFRNDKPLDPGYAIGVDERLVEYPYVFSKLRKEKTVLLDAGSTFNFQAIISHPLITSKEVSIYTYFPESWNFVEKRISYQFGDLRQLPYRDSWFDEIVCISTLEHIGLDNTMYGYHEVKSANHQTGPESYQDAVREMVRVLKPGGQLLMTFPFGVHRNYGFFQQFDSSMLQKIRDIMSAHGNPTTSFFKYVKEGWIRSDEESCRLCESYNPHTGEGLGDDGAAHSRAICATHFIKA